MCFYLSSLLVSLVCVCVCTYVQIQGGGLGQIDSILSRVELSLGFIVAMATFIERQASSSSSSGSADTFLCVKSGVLEGFCWCFCRTFKFQWLLDTCVNCVGVTLCS